MEKFSNRSKDASNKDIPLKQIIPHYENRISKQVLLLQRSLNAFREEHNTSLDIILTRSLNNLRSVSLEYMKILEQILVSRSVIPLPTSGCRRRSLVELVSLARDRLLFEGGSEMLAVEKFLVSMKNAYLSTVEESIYLKYIKSAKKDYHILFLFIEDH